MIDTHTARLAQMVEAADGKADIPAALLAAGFTMSEIADNLFEIEERLSALKTLDSWQRNYEDQVARDNRADDAEGDLYA